MQGLRRVDLTRGLDGLVQAPGTPDDAKRERGTPVMSGRWMLERVADRIQATRELVGIHATEARQHDLPSFFPRFHHVRANLGESCRRHAGTVCQVVDEVQRHVELADGAERLRHTTELLLRFLAFGVLKPFRDDRHGLTQSS
jgi:hypothetical protein